MKKLSILIVMLTIVAASSASAQWDFTREWDMYYIGHMYCDYYDAFFEGSSPVYCLVAASIPTTYSMDVAEITVTADIGSLSAYADNTDQSDANYGELYIYYDSCVNYDVHLYVSNYVFPAHCEYNLMWP